VSSSNRPRARRDEHGECMHLYLTRDATCVHCGMKFGLAWQADRNWLTRPLRKNLGIGFISFALVGGAFLSGVDFVAMAFLFIGIYFIVRALFGTTETFMKHRFVPGKLGVIVPRGRYNVTALKPAITYVGSVKFPIDLDVYSQFREGETLLIEYLKWSRLPVAIYRGHMPG
jgi:hypothetical protein